MPSNRWQEKDGRCGHCPICGARIPVGAVRGHLGSVRCMATVGRRGQLLNPEQLALVAQGQTYDKAIREMMRRERTGAA